MKDHTPDFLELIRLAATSLPPDVERALRAAVEREEPGSSGRAALEAILQNVEMARAGSTPICQDTGTPIFTVHHPAGWSTRALREQIRRAVAEATHRSYLRPNAVDSLSGRNTGDNLGDEHYPTIHFEESEDDALVVDLMLKGGGCENVGAQYRLPDSRLKAGRDLEGVRRAALDAVHQAQGKGCAPGILGIAIGGDRGTSYIASKETLLRQLDDENPDPALAELEDRITEQANMLGVGPMGFGGATTVLGAKVKATHRLPASYFVSISYMCWAYRRRQMTIQAGEAAYS
ncbi:MAG: fumarate hydratase [Chloroflexi bacterium]|nr:fumarate hydratase [Chloroflexota bacterium]